MHRAAALGVGRLPVFVADSQSRVLQAAARLREVVVCPHWLPQLVPPPTGRARSVASILCANIHIYGNRSLCVALLLQAHSVQYVSEDRGGCCPATSHRQNRKQTISSVLPDRARDLRGMSGNSRVGSKGASLWIVGPGPRRPRLEFECLAWVRKQTHSHRHSSAREVWRSTLFFCFVCCPRGATALSRATLCFRMLQRSYASGCTGGEPWRPRRRREILQDEV